MEKKNCLPFIDIDVLYRGGLLREIFTVFHINKAKSSTRTTALERCRCGGASGFTHPHTHKCRAYML